MSGFQFPSVVDARMMDRKKPRTWVQDMVRRPAMPVLRKVAKPAPRKEQKNQPLGEYWVVGCAGCRKGIVAKFTQVTCCGCNKAYNVKGRGPWAVAATPAEAKAKAAELEGILRGAE